MRSSREADLLGGHGRLRGDQRLPVPLAPASAWAAIAYPGRALLPSEASCADARPSRHGPAPDSTVGDMVLVATTYAVAVSANHPRAGDLLSGPLLGLPMSSFKLLPCAVGQDEPVSATYGKAYAPEPNLGKLPGSSIAEGYPTACNHPGTSWLASGLCKYGIKHP
jgi:hypothetical protein